MAGTGCKAACRTWQISLPVSCWSNRPEGSEAQLTEALQGLEDQGLQVVVQADAAAGGSVSAGDIWQISVVGNDRPGIVRELTQVLASHDVNVEDLATECHEAPVSGGRIFRAQARIQLPEGLEIELIQDELERLATDLMIDMSTPESAV